MLICYIQLLCLQGKTTKVPHHFYKHQIAFRLSQGRAVILRLFIWNFAAQKCVLWAQDDVHPFHKFPSSAFKPCLKKLCKAQVVFRGRSCFGQKNMLFWRENMKQKILQWSRGRWLSSSLRLSQLPRACSGRHRGDASVGLFWKEMFYGEPRNRHESNGFKTSSCNVS